MINIEEMTYAYNRRKDALIREAIPFLSYLHYDSWRETGGYQIIKLIEVESLPLTISPRDYLREQGKSNWLTKRGRKHFDRIVRQLEKAGTLIDVTKYMPEDGDT